MNRPDAWANCPPHTFPGFDAEGRPTCVAPPADSLSRIIDRNVAMRAFLLRFLDPEDLGYTVNEAVRNEVRALLGMDRVPDR